MRVLLLSAGLCLIAGCGETQDRTPDRAASATATEAAPSPAPPSEQAAPDLSAYVGKYPFDAVDGVVFIDHPVVRLALESSGAPAEALALARDRNQVVTPIFRSGPALVASGYDPRSGGSVNWNLAVTPDGEHAVVCYQDAPIGYAYEGGKRTHPVQPRCAHDEESAEEQLFEWPS